MIDQVGTELTRRLSQRTTRRSFLARTGMVLMGTAARMAAEPELGRMTAQASHSSYHSCSPCRYCHLCGKPLPDCNGYLYPWSCCPGGSKECGAWAGRCCCGGTMYTYKYSDCYGGSPSCGSMWCTKDSSMCSEWQDAGTYRCTRVLRVATGGACSSHGTAWWSSPDYCNTNHC